MSEDATPEKGTPGGKKKIAAILAGVIVLAGAAGGTVYYMTHRDDDTPKIGYAEGVTALDEDSLQKAVDEMYAKVDEGNIALEYRNDAFSEDGKNFECYIGNSLANEYDMYIGIYSDNTFKDELYLSGLFRPGEAFKNVELNHALEKGDHRVYVSFTQVEKDLETIHGQIMVTMDFHVS